MTGSGGGATRRVVRRVSEAESGRTLAAVLGDALAAAAGEDVPRSRVRAMIATGAVQVDGRPLRVAARPLRSGQRVETIARLDELRPPTRSTDRPFRLGPEAVLYRDRWLIAVAKPAGLPAHATADPARASLAGHVQRLLATSGATVAVHQRLDRDTSGVVVFGLAPEANAGLSRAFAGRAAEKTYLALTARPVPLPPREIVVDAPLADGGPARRPVRVDGVGARPAETCVVVREVLADALLVEARPRTGRKHQVRVHLAHAGMPVLGDPVYGKGTSGAAGAAPRLMLHASRLALAHPVTGRPLVVDCPIPPDFGAVLERLRAARRR
jgi:23S rRNA pseudouridine1911/1915/1917 synthase